MINYKYCTQQIISMCTILLEDTDEKGQDHTVLLLALTEAAGQLCKASIRKTKEG